MRAEYLETVIISFLMLVPNCIAATWLKNSSVSATAPYMIRHFFFDIFIFFCLLDPDCKGKFDGYYIVNNKCEAYYSCVNQRRVQFVTCPSDQYFDHCTKVYNKLSIRKYLST